MLGRSLKYQAGTAVALALIAGIRAEAAPAPVVDTKTPSTVTNITREQLDRLPVGRRVEDLIKTCSPNTIPTISTQPDVLIDGKPLIDINCVQPDDLDMIEVYKTHNTERAKYGAPPLVWAPLLVQGPQGAKSHVNQLARTGKQVHATREGRGNVRENISQGLPGWSAMQLTGSWLKEKQNFVPGTFPNVSRTHNWYDVGHIAQILWIQTVMIGCARAAGIGSSWLVCRYGPGGNRDGETVGIPPPRPYLVEAPKLPDTEVFKQAEQGEREQTFHKAVTDALFKEIGSVSSIGYAITPSFIDFPVESWGEFSAGLDLGNVCQRPSMFDLGTYGGGARCTDWFAIADDGSLVDANVEQPELPTTEVYTRPARPTALDDFAKRQWEAVMKMAEGTPYEQTVSNLIIGYSSYVDGKWSCNQALELAGKGQVDAALAALKQMKAQMTETGEFAAADVEEIDTLIADYESLMHHQDPKGYPPPGENAGSAAAERDGKIEQPDLPTKEVFNPADAPKCRLEIM